MIFLHEVAKYIEIMTYFTINHDIKKVDNAHGNLCIFFLQTQVNYVLECAELSKSPKQPNCQNCIETDFHFNYNILSLANTSIQLALLLFDHELELILINLLGVSNSLVALAN